MWIIAKALATVAVTAGVAGGLAALTAVPASAEQSWVYQGSFSDGNGGWVFVYNNGSMNGTAAAIGDFQNG